MHDNANSCFKGLKGFLQYLTHQTHKILVTTPYCYGGITIMWGRVKNFEVLMPSIQDITKTRFQKGVFFAATFNITYLVPVLAHFVSDL